MAKSTPPGPDMAGGKLGLVGYVVLRWKEGPVVMIWHDLESASSQGSGSTEDAMYRLHGYAASQNGHRVDWEAQTADGRAVQFWIDNTSYDLTDGTLFIITTKNAGTDVKQLNRDLSAVQANRDSCVAFANSDPDVAKFVADVSNPQ